MPGERAAVDRVIGGDTAGTRKEGEILGYTAPRCYAPGGKFFKPC